MGNGMTRTVVTGAAGFLGSHLTDALLAGPDRVVGIDNLSTGRRANLTSARRSGRFRLRTGDLTLSPRLPPADRYFHLASPASPPAYARDPVGTLLVNSVGTRAVLEAARRSDATVVLASTSEVYGDPEVHPQTEGYWGHVNPIGPRSCYDEGKRFSEALGMAYRRAYDLDVRIARIFNTYGPRMDAADGRVVSNFVVQALAGRSLTVYGTGRQTRSFCYVSDTVRGLLTLGSGRQISGPVNLGNPHEVTVLALAETIARLVGVRLRVVRTSKPVDDPRRRCPSIQLARRALGWSPEVSLEEGLRHTIDYFGRALAEASRGP